MERYAVDFGTSNTVVARWNFAREEPQTMSFPAITAPGSGAMPPVTPSVLYYRGEESFLMGYEVTSRGLDDIRSSRYFWGFKRGLLHLTSLYEDRGREFSADHIARLYLTRLLGNLELNADTVVTFTAPVNAFDTYREWISAFFAENYPDVPYRLVDESVAAAISYGSTRAGSVVCVVDFGGGTLDVSVVRMPESFAGAAAGEAAKGRVLGKAGAFLGGDDIDRWLLEDLLMRAGRTAEECEEILPQLTTLARQIKEELSAQSESSRSFFDAEHFKTYEFRYTQNDLLDLLEEHDFFVTLNDVLNNAVNMAEAGGISRSQIERVLLVGGTTLIPAVQRGIRGIFGREKVQCHKPFEAVAHGALAFSLGLNIVDFIQHSYAIRYLDSLTKEPRYKIIFKAGSEYPSEKPVTLTLSSSFRNQKAIELMMAEIEHKRMGRVSFDADGRFSAVDDSSDTVRLLNYSKNSANAAVIAKLEPPGTPLDKRLNVAFSINARKELPATVHDNLTGQDIYVDMPLVALR